MYRRHVYLYALELSRAPHGRLKFFTLIECRQDIADLSIYNKRSVLLLFHPMNSAQDLTSLGISPSLRWGIFAAIHFAANTAVRGSLFINVSVHGRNIIEW